MSPQNTSYMIVVTVCVIPSGLGNVTLYLCSGCGDCMKLNPDILLSFSGLVVSQPVSQSVGRGSNIRDSVGIFLLIMFT